MPRLGDLGPAVVMAGCVLYEAWLLWRIWHGW